MHSEYSQDLSDPDQIIRAVLAERPGKPVRIRIQPMILRQTVPNKNAQYQGWRQVAWTLECDSVAEAFELRNALQAFFETLGALGPATVHQALSAMRAAVRPLPPSMHPPVG